MKKRFLSALAVLLFAATAAIAATTTHYSWSLPVVGASQNTWGSTLNTAFNAIDTNLWTVAGGLNIAVNAPAASASNITLTNPITSTQNISFSGAGLKLILPAMNASSSMVPGGVLRVTNVGSNTFGVYAQDASTAVVATLTAGQSVEITLTSGATANGTFLVSGPFLTVVGSLSLGGSVTTASPSISTDATTGFYTAGAAEVDVSVSGTQEAKWTSSGYNLPYTTASSLLGTDASKNVVTLSAIPNGVTATTQTANDNSTKVATTAYVNSALGGALVLVNGTTATTQSANDNSTKVATTAYTDASRKFGAWGSSFNINTIYQASTDGFALCNVIFAGNNATAGVTGISDSATTPTTLRTHFTNDLNAYTWAYTALMPVRKNDYWEFTSTGSITVQSIFFLPVGN